MPDMSLSLTHLWHIYSLQHNWLCMKVKYMSFLLHSTVYHDLLHLMCTLSHPRYFSGELKFAFVIIDNDIANDETNIYMVQYIAQ